MKLAARVLQQSIPLLVRVACVCALIGLSLMLVSLVFPRPLLVIGAMSIGHGLGVVAFGCYALSVLLDAYRQGRKRGDAPTEPPQ